MQGLNPANHDHEYAESMSALWFLTPYCSLIDFFFFHIFSIFRCLTAQPSSSSGAHDGAPIQYKSGALVTLIRRIGNLSW